MEMCTRCAGRGIAAIAPSSCTVPSTSVRPGRTGLLAQCTTASAPTSAAVRPWPVVRSTPHRRLAGIATCPSSRTRATTLLPNPPEPPVTPIRTKNSPPSSCASPMRPLSGWRKWAPPGGGELAGRHRTPPTAIRVHRRLAPRAPGLAADAPLPLVRLGGQRPGQELTERDPGGQRQADRDGAHQQVQPLHEVAGVDDVVHRPVDRQTRQERGDA